MKQIFFIFMVTFVASFVLSAQTVVIAKESTRYKNALVEVLVEKLEVESFTTVVIDHKELSSIDPADYTAVYVVNSGVMSRVRPAVMEWLDSISGNDGNVIVHTTQKSTWTPEISVDSITSASETSNIEYMTDSIVTKITALLQSPE